MMVPPMGWKSRVDYHPMIDRRNRPERRAGALPCILPNHKYVTFTIADLVTEVSDNCDSIAIGSVQIASVTSDEPENGVGDGNTLMTLSLRPTVDRCSCVPNEWVAGMAVCTQSHCAWRMVQEMSVPPR